MSDDLRVHPTLHDWRLHPKFHDWAGLQFFDATRAGTAVASGPAMREPIGPLDAYPIEELAIGVRAYNALKHAGVETIGELVTKTATELLAIPKFGRRSLDHVNGALNELGYPEAS